MEPKGNCLIKIFSIYQRHSRHHHKKDKIATKKIQASGPNEQGCRRKLPLLQRNLGVRNQNILLGVVLGIFAVFAVLGGWDLWGGISCSVHIRCGVFGILPDIAVQ